MQRYILRYYLKTHFVHDKAKLNYLDGKLKFVKLFWDNFNLKINFDEQC